MTEDPHALIIMLLWLAIWAHLAWGGRDRTPLRSHPALQKYTALVGGGFFLFYTFLFTGVGAASLPESPLSYLLGWVLLSLGALLIVLARHRLRHLGALSVLVGLSETTTPHALDRYTGHHPMYVGMGLLALGSLLWFPNLAGVLTLGLICIGLFGKARIENEHHQGRSF